MVQRGRQLAGSTWALECMNVARPTLFHDRVAVCTARWMPGMTARSKDTSATILAAPHMHREARCGMRSIRTKTHLYNVWEPAGTTEGKDLPKRESTSPNAPA
jgi:hypothetical protein